MTDKKDKEKPGPEGPDGAEGAKDLFGDPVNGKFLCNTRLQVSVNEDLDKVGIFQLAEDKFRVVKNKVEGIGSSVPEAIREFKKAYKAAN
jgi:hypothetical protein